MCVYLRCRFGQRLHIVQLCSRPKVFGVWTLVGPWNHFWWRPGFPPPSSCLLGCVVESPQLVPRYSTLSDYLTSGRWGCIRDSVDSSVLVPLPVAPVQFRKRSTAWSLEGGVALDTLEILQCFRCSQSPRLPSYQFRERQTSCPLPSVVPSSTASGPRAAGPSDAFFV